MQSCNIEYFWKNAAPHHLLNHKSEGAHWNFWKDLSYKVPLDPALQDIFIKDL